MNATRLILLATVLPLLAVAQDPALRDPVPATTVAAQNGFVFANGRIYQIRNGQATPVERDLTLTITPTGITGFDGRAINLAEGQMFTTDGRILPTPTGIIGLPGRAAGLQPVAPVQGIVTPGTSPGTNVKPGTSPGTGAAPGTSPGTGTR